MPDAAKALAAAAADPTPGQQIFTALLTSVGKIAKGLAGAPLNVLRSIGQLLQGNVLLAVNEIVAIVSDPILSIGTDEVPAILSALGRKFPQYADAFNSLNFPIQLVGLSALNVFAGGGLAGDLQNIVTGISNGLLQGNVFVAAKNALTATGGLFTNLYKNVLGPDFSVRTQLVGLAQAIATAFRPVPAITDTADPSPAAHPVRVESPTAFKGLGDASTASLPQPSSETISAESPLPTPAVAATASQSVESTDTGEAATLKAGETTDTDSADSTLPTSTPSSLAQENSATTPDPAGTAGKSAESNDSNAAPAASEASETAAASTAASHTKSSASSSAARHPAVNRTAKRGTATSINDR